MDKCLVYFSCDTEAVITIDGVFYGEIDKLPITLSNGKHYVSIQSLDTVNAPPTLRKAEIDNGYFKMKGANICVWPNGICEAHIFAPCSVSTLMRDCNRLSEKTWAVLYDGSVSIENELGKCLFSHQLPFLTNVKLTVTGGCVSVLGNLGLRQYLCLISGEKDKYSVIQEEFADDLVISESGNRVAVVNKLGDTGRAKQRVMSIQSGNCDTIREERIWLDEPNIPDNPLQTVKIFAEAIMCNSEAEAVGLLDSSISDNTTFSEIKEFFGDFCLIKDPVYYKTKNTALMFGFNDSDYIKLVPYGFSVIYDNGWKIDNFFEL